MKILRLIYKKTEIFFRNRRPFGFNTGGNRVFFPGCSLASSDPDLTAKVHEFLKMNYGDVGMWSVCCGKPLGIFVDESAAEGVHRELLKEVEDKGITEIITACGNCIDEFRIIDAPIKITSLYELLAGHEWKIESQINEWSVHHPCPARVDEYQKKSFIALSESVGLNIKNLESKSHALSCCLSRTDVSKNKIKKNSQNTFVTYCAHCTRAFQKNLKTYHILQLLFNSTKMWHRISILKQFRSYFKLFRIYN